MITLDNYQVHYSVILERMPIFYPFEARTHSYYRNRYQISKKANFISDFPKEIKLEDGDYIFGDYDKMNIENVPTHEIKVDGEPVFYRANSRLWRHVDPTIVDPHSIQTYSSNNVFLIVKNKGNKWVDFY